ncbi:MAG: hypothetical protein P1V19_02335 [Gimesia sp.]|nr:hypothetical protein [Gimesia sp.]
MSDEAHRTNVNQPAQRHLFHFVICGLLLWLIYAGITWLSGRFSFQTPGIERPLIEVLCLLATAFVIYLVSIRVAIRAGKHPLLLPVTVVFAFSMRLLLLFSEPIQEVDIYRYLWDGQATIHGVSPFQYSPLQVLNSSADQTHSPELSRLVAARDSSPAIKKILKRVHYAELSTVYPPVSQGIFALAALTTPAVADLSTHLIVMKGWIIAFDMATIWVLIQILRFTEKPVGWLVVYAWCPLVLKEFANSGHLDSIAVCLCTLAVYFMLRAFYRCADHKIILSPKQSTLMWGVGASVFLGLAVGAKLYPVVLAPLLIFGSLRKGSWSCATMIALVFMVVSTGVCWPMLQHRVHPSAESRVVAHHSLNSKSGLPPIPHATTSPVKIQTGQQDAGDGLITFLSRWKMNDFLFMLISENLTPSTGVPRSQRPWFVITSEDGRETLGKQFAGRLSIQQKQVPFVLARAVTAGGFILLACCFCWRAIRANEATQFLEAVFLTLAWFWLLLPTQNPWYWTWAVPFLPFANNRAWLALSGLTLLYYLRFWLGYHWPDSPLFFTVYSGKPFFDFVVIWIEFGLWFSWLAISSFRNQHDTKRND